MKANGGDVAIDSQELSDFRGLVLLALYKGQTKKSKLIPADYRHINLLPNVLDILTEKGLIQQEEATVTLTDAGKDFLDLHIGDEDQT